MFRYFLMLSVLFSFTAQASLFDYYGLATIRSLPDETLQDKLEQLLVTSIFQHHPFPVTSDELWVLRVPHDTIAIKSLSGVNFYRGTLIIQDLEVYDDLFYKPNTNGTTLHNWQIVAVRVTPVSYTHSKAFSQTVGPNGLKSQRTDEVHDWNKMVVSHAGLPYLSNPIFISKARWRLYYTPVLKGENTECLVKPQDIKTNFIAVIDRHNPKILEIWKRRGATDWKQVALVHHPEDVYSASFDSSYKILATACKDNKVRIWNLDCLHTPLTDYMPHKKITLEQLLFLKLLNDCVATKNRLPVESFMQLPDNNLDFAAQLLGGDDQEHIKEYLLSVLHSFGDTLKQTLITRYNLAYKPSRCSIQ